MASDLPHSIPPPHPAYGNGSSPKLATIPEYAAAEADGDPAEGVGSGVPLNLIGHLHKELTHFIDHALSRKQSEQSIKAAARQKVRQLCQEHPELGEWPELDDAVEQTLSEALGRGPLEALLQDPTVADILINGPRQIFVERHGRLEATSLCFRDERHLQEVVARMLEGSGRRLDAKSPIVDARLVDGSRLNAIIKPLALNGPIVSIRRVNVVPMSIERLVELDSLTKEMVEFLKACVKARVNMLISGGTGSGKTTLLNCLSRYIPQTERIATIEDVAELQLQQPHVVMLEARPSSDTVAEVSIRELVKNSLRMRPDRIIIGECRGIEVLDVLQAMNTGHEGSLTTIHANGAREAVSRIELMIGLGGLDLPSWAVRKQIASSIHVVVQVARVAGGRRKVLQIAEITGTEGDVISMHDLFEFVQVGIDEKGVATGFFRSTGIAPHILRRLASYGAELPMQLFSRRNLTPVSA